MANANLLRALYPTSPVNGGATFNSFTLNGSTLRVGWCFQFVENVTVTHLLFRYGVRTGTPPTFRISLQGVDASGQPDGTVLGGGSPASATFTPPADATWNSTVQAVALSNSYAASRGEVASMVIDYDSGTIDGSNNSSFTHSYDGAFGTTRLAIPYTLTYNGSAWSKIAFQPLWGYRSSTLTYAYPLQADYATAVSSSGHRAALKFNLPAGWGSTYQIAGARMSAQFPAAGTNTWTLGLWDAAGTALQSKTFDPDYSRSPGLTYGDSTVYFEGSLATLDYGTDYYLGIERGGANVVLYGISMADANSLTAFPGGNIGLLSTWNGSAWTDDTTTRPLVELIFADITEPTGGGGGGGNLIIAASSLKL